MSNTTASGSLGTVSMYPEYNTAATMPEDKFTLLGKTNAVSANQLKTSSVVSNAIQAKTQAHQENTSEMVQSQLAKIARTTTWVTW